MYFFLTLLHLNLQESPTVHWRPLFLVSIVLFMGCAAIWGGQTKNWLNFGVEFLFTVLTLHIDPAMGLFFHGLLRLWFRMFALSIPIFFAGLLFQTRQQLCFKSLRCFVFFFLQNWSRAPVPFLKAFRGCLFVIWEEMSSLALRTFNWRRFTQIKCLIVLLWGPSIWFFCWWVAVHCCCWRK